MPSKVLLYTYPSSCLLTHLGEIFPILWSNSAILIAIQLITLLALFASGKNKTCYNCIELQQVIAIINAQWQSLAEGEISQFSGKIREKGINYCPETLKNMLTVQKRCQYAIKTAGMPCWHIRSQKSTDRQYHHYQHHQLQVARSGWREDGGVLFNSIMHLCRLCTDRFKVTAYPMRNVGGSVAAGRGACTPGGTVQGAAFVGANAKIWNSERTNWPNRV